MKRFNKVVALSLAVVLGTAMGCFAQNSEWKNDLRTKFLNNESVIMEINLRSFNAQDLDGDGFIQEDLGEVKGSFINAIARLNEKKNLGINTCIDTAGEPFTKEGEWFEKFKKLMEVTDILLMDIKHIDEEEHIKLTGRTGKNIIEMFRYLDEIKKPIWIRHVLVPGITDNDEYLLRTRDFIRTLSNVQRVEILPYHGLGAMKYKDLGIDYVLKDTESPSAERVANAKKILECEKYDGWKK